MDLPIGVSDFRELREKGLVYVDKTGLIVEMLDHPGSKVLLLPRPRRFGKTLALSMLRYYFERRDDDLSGLFEGLEVWRAGEAYRRHFRRYPVMFLTFRDIESSTFEGCRAELYGKIQVLFREHRSLLDSGVLNRAEAREYQAILDGAAAPVLYHHALGELSKYLHRATGERTIVLIDEYDEPLRAGFVNDYGPQAIELFHTVLADALKDNSYLERGVMTGVLWVPGSSIFSGLDNLHVHTLLQRSFSTCFGFTELDVAVLLDMVGRAGALEVVRARCDCYEFGGTEIHSPWSVLAWLADEGASPRSRWFDASSDPVVRRLSQGRAAELHESFSRLVAGESVERVLDETVALDHIAKSDAALWSQLVFAGYLRAQRLPPVRPDWRAAHRLSIPTSSAAS